MILFLDTETGGLDENLHSLLSASFILVSDELKVVDRFYIDFQPEVYHVTREAMIVNKIDLATHSGVSYYTGVWDLRAWYRPLCKGSRPTLAGWNLDFDMRFLGHYLLDLPSDFKHEFSHRRLDVQTVAKFCKDAGVISPENMKLQTVYESMFHDGGEIAWHTSMGDAEATFCIYRELVQRFK